MNPLDELRVWRDLHARRDGLIREAYADGVPVPAIMEASGLSKAIVYRIVQRK